MTRKPAMTIEQSDIGVTVAILLVATALIVGVFGAAGTFL
jgi:hypothetical protein